MSELFPDLDLDSYNQIPIREDVPYMAEGHQIARIAEGPPHDPEFIITDGGRRGSPCQSHHDWSKVPEGADPSYVCWNCDAVKFPRRVLVDD